jgi:hypothetical protein
MLSFQVAARVKSDDEKDEWFVVKVIHFDKETKEYVSIYSLPSVVHAFLLIWMFSLEKRNAYWMEVTSIAYYCLNWFITWTKIGVAMSWTISGGSG